LLLSAAVSRANRNTCFDAVVFGALCPVERFEAIGKSSNDRLCSRK